MHNTLMVDRKERQMYQERFYVVSMGLGGVSVGVVLRDTIVKHREKSRAQKFKRCVLLLQYEVRLKTIAQTLLKGKKKHWLFQVYIS